MRRVQRTGVPRRRRGGWKVVLGAAALALGGAVAVSGGARAERSAAVQAPTLESLLERREALEAREAQARHPRDPGSPQQAPEPPVRPAPAPADLRDRHRALQQRRAAIADSLPPALRKRRSRQPELRDPPSHPRDRSAVVAVDHAGTDNPDGVVFQVAR